MPIFIAKTYNGLVESVVLARNYGLAQAYWQGKGVNAHTTAEMNEFSLEENLTGVIPIVSTCKVSASKFGGKQQDFLAVSKG